MVPRATRARRPRRVPPVFEKELVINRCKKEVMQKVGLTEEACEVLRADVETAFSVIPPSYRSPYAVNEILERVLEKWSSVVKCNENPWKLLRLLQKLDMLSSDIQQKAFFLSPSTHNTICQLETLAEETEHLEDDLWNLTCRFFKRDYKDFTTPISLPGLSAPLQPYQAMAVAFCLQQHKTFHGGVLGDNISDSDRFLIILAICLLNHLLERNYLDVEESRRHSTFKWHCAPDAPPSSRCPSTSSWPFQCSCEPNSPSKHLGYRAGPHVMVIPGKRILNTFQSLESFLDEDEHDGLQLILSYGYIRLYCENIPVVVKNICTDFDTHKAKPGQTRFLILTTPNALLTHVCGYAKEYRAYHDSPEYFDFLQNREVFELKSFHTYEQVVKTTNSNGLTMLPPTMPQLPPIKETTGPSCIFSIMFLADTEITEGGRKTFHDHALSGRMRVDIGDPYLWGLPRKERRVNHRNILLYVRYLCARWAGMDPDTLTEDVKEAHRICGYSNLLKTQQRLGQVTQQIRRIGENNHTSLKARSLLYKLQVQMHCLSIRRTQSTRWLDGSLLVPLPPIRPPPAHHDHVENRA